ncbi:hypothetical protein EIP91_001638 [Steccherinum ochraceum]|uniref:DUF6533 domain-containing protein n=1 Tax=Steccherinum ochraceum TaxID=92696 RepID=A0A4R0RJZ9_9APHY|nr:hypothetical protein EIP91_001638 [Steccherinum ochraceum]
MAADFASQSDAYLIAAIALLAYDTLLTFSRELECIWNRRLNAAAVLFVMQRYTALVHMSFHALTLARQPTSERCAAFNIISSISAILNLFGAGVFCTLRVWAIYGRRLLPGLLVLSVSVIWPIINIYTMSHVSAYTLHDGACGILSVFRLRPRKISVLTHLIRVVVAILNRSMAITSDLLVVALTWYRVSQIWSVKELRSFKPRLTTVLLHDGTLYCIALLSFNVVALIIEAPSTNADISASYFIYLCEAVSSNLIARFLLDLRAVFFTDLTSAACTDSQGQGHTPHISTNTNTTTIHFARFTSSFAGNLGATVGVEESVWVTDAALAEPSGVREQRVLDPFAVGLFEAREESPVSV